MPKMILVYVVCSNKKEAGKIAKILLKKKLCGCTNMIDKMSSLYIWPPSSNKIEKSTEIILLIKTLKDKFMEISKEIEKVHSYDVPCIFEISVGKINDNYFNWLKKQIKL